jgi:hypothetical protein
MRAIMNRRALTACSIVFAAAWATGCGARAPEFNENPVLVAPIGLEDHVAFLDSNRAEARLIDVSGSGASRTPTVVPIVRNTTHVELRNGHSDQLLALCAGQRDIEGASPEQPGLVLLDASGKTKTYRYDSAFDRIVQSEDGKFAFLFFDPTTSGGDILKNPNEVAVIDLEAEETKPTLKTLRSLGESPRAIAFSDRPIPIGGTERNLAVVLSNRAVAVVDLAHLDRSEFTVELAKPGASGVSAAQVLFSTEEEKPKIYVRAEGTDDVFVVSIESESTSVPPNGAVSQGHNDFALSLNQFSTGAGARPGDIALFSDGGKVRLLVTGPGNRTAVVVDADTGNTTSVTLPGAASRIHLFTGPKPSDPTPASRALLYSPGSQAVVFLDLEGFGSTTNRGGNADLLTLPVSYAELAELNDDTVMFLNQSAGLSMLKLGDRTLSPITGPSLADAVPDLDVNKIWLAPSGPRLGYLDLPNFHPNEVRLDAPIEHLVRVPPRSKGRPKVVVTHPSSIGSMTVLDADDPADLGLAFRVEDFLLEGVLNGGRR